MTSVNETKNQHYISQAEQRLNAINPRAPKKAQRIFALKVLDREACRLSATDPSGEPIRKSLSGIDLFTLDVIDVKRRLNLETLFQKHEQSIAAHSEALLAKLQLSPVPSIEAELRGVFAAKLMNLMRNPFCVRKMLNTFGAVLDYKFTDPQLQADYEAAMRGSRPQQPAVCARYQITADEYDRWLRALLKLLSVPPTRANAFEDAIDGLFESNFVTVHVFHYMTSDPQHVCLLPDRGFNTDPVPVSAGAEAMAFEFNISARAFACYAFWSPTALATRNHLRAKVSDAARANVRVKRVEDEFVALAKYNRRTISHCAEQVFAASSRPLL